jgi:hypothetical protein
MNVSALAGSSRTAVRDAFKCTRGTVSGAPRRTRHAGDAASRTARTKERILELPEAAVLETGFGATVIGVATGWLSQPS